MPFGVNKKGISCSPQVSLLRCRDKCNRCDTPKPPGAGGGGFGGGRGGGRPQAAPQGPAGSLHNPNRFFCLSVLAQSGYRLPCSLSSAYKHIIYALWFTYYVMKAFESCTVIFMSSLIIFGSVYILWLDVPRVVIWKLPMVNAPGSNASVKRTVKQACAQGYNSTCIETGAKPLAGHLTKWFPIPYRLVCSRRLDMPGVWQPQLGPPKHLQSVQHSKTRHS